MALLKEISIASSASTAAHTLTDYTVTARMQSLSSPLALVIGAGGFLGGHLVQQLLEKGYRVRGTVHDDPAKDDMRYKHLTSLSGAVKRLSLVQLDLGVDVGDASWDIAFEGDVSIVFHTSGPHKPYLKAVNPEEELVSPVVNGAIGVCAQVDKRESISQLIVTSCIDALTDAFDEREYSEADWNTTSTILSNPNAYAKTTAEKYILTYFDVSADTLSPKSTRKTPLHVASILPGAMFGAPIAYTPPLSRVATWREATDESVAPPSSASLSFGSLKAPVLPTWHPRISASHRLLLSYLNGGIRGAPNLYLSICDVRDVANAHIIAAERNSSSGDSPRPKRYILGPAKPISHAEMLQIIHDNFNDEVKVPSRRIPDRAMRVGAAFDSTGRGAYVSRNLGRQPLLNTARAQDAGMTLRPPEQPIVDAVRFLLDRSLVEYQPPQSCAIL